MSAMLALVVTLLIVLANAFFVAAEFAFVKIRPTRLQQLAEPGPPARAAADDDHQPAARLSVGEPARHHAGVADAWAGWASRRSPRCCAR